MTSVEEFLKAVEVLKKANEFEIGHGRSEIYHFEEHELTQTLVVYSRMIYKEELKQMNFKFIMPKDDEMILIQF